MRDTIPLIAMATMMSVMHKDSKAELKEEIKSEIMAEIKDDVKSVVATEVKDAIIETKTKIATTTNNVSDEMSKMQLKYTTEIDKRDAADKKLNIIFSGIPLDPRERTNPGIIANIIVTKLKDHNCDIKTEDLAFCYRINRKGGNRTDIPIIFTRCVSHQVKEKIISCRKQFNNMTTNTYMNEDMTTLQHKLFKYLRTREDILLKNSVGYRDGKIIFLLKANETSKKWSRIETVLDIAGVDKRLVPDMENEEVTLSLGLKDCSVNLPCE